MIAYGNYVAHFATDSGSARKRNEMCTRSASKVIIQYVPTLFCALVSKAQANDVIRKLNEGLRNHSVCIAFFLH